MYVESFEKLSGNDMFEGFAVDLAHELSLVLGFNYTIKLVDDGKVDTMSVDRGKPVNSKLNHARLSCLDPN